jgi:hypothetical protein
VLGSGRARPRAGRVERSLFRLRQVPTAGAAPSPPRPFHAAVRRQQGVDLAREPGAQAAAAVERPGDERAVVRRLDVLGERGGVVARELAGGDGGVEDLADRVAPPRSERSLDDARGGVEHGVVLDT